MQGFREIDQIHGLACLDGLVEGADAPDSDDRAPVGIILQGGGNLCLASDRHHFAEIVHGRELEAHPVADSYQVKNFQVARGRDQRAVERVVMPVQMIDVAGECPDTFLKGGFHRLLVVPEYSACLFCFHRCFAERKIPADELLHLFLDGIDVLIFYEIAFRPAVFSPSRLLKLAVKSARERVVDIEYLVREKLPHGILEDETQRPYVGKTSFRAVVSQEFDVVEIASEP